MTEEQFEKVAYLNKAYNTDKKLKALKEVKASIRTTATGRYKFETARGANSYKQNNVELRMQRIVELDEQIEQAEKQLETELNELYDIIDGVQDLEYQVILIYRYMHFRTLEDIAGKLELNKKTISRKLRDAIDLVTVLKATTPAQSEKKTD